MPWYKKNFEEKLMMGVWLMNILNSDGSRQKKEYKQDKQNESNRWQNKKKCAAFM